MVSVNLVANTNLRTADEFRQLVIKEDKGVVVRIGDVADVVLGAENSDSDVRFNGQAATFMGVWVLPTANSLEVIKKVREVMPDIQAQLPAGMKAGIPYDSTAYIQDAIDEVLKTLTETLLIVVLVIFLFLGSVRSVIIPVGNCAWIPGMASRTLLITSSELAVGSTHTPMKVAVSPLKRTSES